MHLLIQGLKQNMQDLRENKKRNYLLTIEQEVNRGSKDK